MKTKITLMLFVSVFISLSNVYSQWITPDSIRVQDSPSTFATGTNCHDRCVY